MTVRFGLNRWDMRSPAAFAADVRRGEELGWDAAFIPSSPLLVRDPYVMLAAAAGATSRIVLAPLIESPRMRHPAVLAGSVATLDELAPGRTWLGLGAGDTSVRLVGRRPARVGELEAAAKTARGLLAGEPLELGGARPARLRHARPVPVWIAAGGPRTLRAAGRVADGVFLRVGTHPANLRAAVESVRHGAQEAGRDPERVRLGAIFHTLLGEDRARIGVAGRSIAAGYYEYSPMLFEPAGLSWDGPPIEELRTKVWPDFHHQADLLASGALVDFLPAEAVDAFALHGSPDDVARRLRSVLDLDLGIEIVVPHPVSLPPGDGDRAGADFAERFARDVMPQVAAAGRGA